MRDDSRHIGMVAKPASLYYVNGGRCVFMAHYFIFIEGFSVFEFLPLLFIYFAEYTATHEQVTRSAPTRKPDGTQNP